MSSALMVSEFFDGLKERFPALGPLMGREGQFHLSMDAHAAHALIEGLIRGEQARFCDRFATDDRAAQGTFGLWTVLFCPLPAAYLLVHSPISPEHSAFASLAAQVPAANWAEREVRDMLGLTPVGHPDPRRLVLFEDWPDGLHPLRKDFDLTTQAPRLDRPFETRPVQGEGVFEVLVGPVHAGIIEPGHFRFSVDGETVLNLEARLFWKHRGLEKRAEDLSFEAALLVAERLCGACSFANALAYCQAIETMSQTAVPPRAQLIRVVAAELERMVNHVGDVGGILLDVAYSVGAAHAQRLREELLQLNDLLAGNRLLMGLCVPGGVRRDLSPAVQTLLAGRLEALEADFRDLAAIALHNETVLDRLDGTGVLEKPMAQGLGVVGPAARAAGLDLDVRRDHPYAAYGRLRFEVPVGERGDVFTRFQIKAREFGQSVRLIQQAIALLTEGPIVRAPAAVAPGAFALGATESARGENLHFVQSGENGRIARYHVRTSSYANWPALPVAILGNIVPDFPVVNKSFNLCYACTDR